MRVMPENSHEFALGRRAFLQGAAGGLGSIALSCLLGENQGARATAAGVPDLPHHPPRARRVIYLFQSGGPSQMDLFDYKPRLADMRGRELPDSIRQGQRLTAMTATQESFPVA